MSSVETNQNFNPSWIGSAYRGGHGNSLGGGDRGGAVISRVLGETDNKEYPLAPPVFVEHRYGREDLLALVGKDSRPPEGLERCQELFVEQCQQPVSIYPLSEREQSMIQNNINSSKAMSSLSPAERAQVLASGGGGTANTGFQRPNVPQTGGGWTPVKSSSWNRGNATNRGTMGRGGFTTGGYPGRGGGSSATSQQGNVAPNEDGNSPYGQRYVPRNARGVPPNGRGGSTAVPSFNTRAQGLYNPKDPKDRPRARLRSTSEDDVQNTNGGSNSSGWKPMRLDQRSEENGGGGNGWPRRNTTDGGLLPEWMNSDDEEPLDKPISISRESSDERNTGAAAQMMNSSSEPRQNREELNREQRPAWARQVSATGMAASNPQDVDRVLAAQERAVMEQRAQPTTTSAPPPTTSGYPFDQALFSGIPSEYSTTPLQPADPAPPSKFYYMDPTKVERGPFEKDQMEQWFKIGYFETSLLLRRDTEREFKSLGELQAMNGAATPFDFKAPSPPPPQTSAQFGQMPGWNMPRELAYLYGTNQNTTYQQSASVLRQQIEQETQRRLLIHQEEIYQQLLREQQKKDEQQRMEYKAREEQLRAYQEEIQRREQAMKETAKQLETRLEMERLEIEEKAKEVARERQRVAAIEEAKRAEARREEEEKKRLEEDRIRRELELRRLEEEQERKKLEEEERKKRAELAAENERRRLEIASREAVAQLKQREEAEKLKKEEELKRKREQLKKNEELRLMAEREVERNRFQVTEDWETAGKPKKEAKEKAKVTPWSSTSAPREKTMAEIMKEEERQAAAERRQNEALRKEELRTQQSIQSAGTWSNAATRLANNPPKARASSSSAWGAVSSEPARVNPILDGPSLASANKVTPKPKPPPTKAAPAPSISKPTPKAQPPSLQQWATSRMKQLNEDVEAEVLYSFVADVDSPAEVEDYLIGYLGESKAVKEFVKEFIKKRSDARGGKKTETIASTNSEWTAQQTGKKKKGKGRTLVIDGSCLGFTPTGDPNRTNKGEIETVPLQSGSRR
ncbi:unnamed protein product, partial [Mesorhabditis belari]|uniref:GYF domain-containing protein n=1 Tax=Mesorhabditis belari TaxID=2138241 RepID=A0AAF3JAA9_9BILA